MRMHVCIYTLHSYLMAQLPQSVSRASTVCHAHPAEGSPLPRRNIEAEKCVATTCAGSLMDASADKRNKELHQLKGHGGAGRLEWTVRCHSRCMRCATCHASPKNGHITREIYPSMTHTPSTPHSQSDSLNLVHERRRFVMHSPRREVLFRGGVWAPRNVSTQHVPPVVELDVL